MIRKLKNTIEDHVSCQEVPEIINKTRAGITSFLKHGDEVIDLLNHEQRQSVNEIIVNNNHIPISAITLAILTGNLALSFTLNLTKEIIVKPCYHGLAELFFYSNALRSFEDGIFCVFQVQHNDIFYLEPSDQDRVSFMQNVHKVIPNSICLDRRIKIFYQCIAIAFALAFKFKEK